MTEQSGRLLKIRDVVAETSLHRATIYREIAAGRFPRARKISPQRVAWPADDVEAWKRGEWKPAGGLSGGPAQPKA